MKKLNMKAVILATILILGVLVQPLTSHSNLGGSNSPRIYSVEELRRQVSSENFAVRANINRFRRARATMLMRYNNLFPHLSINSIVAIASMSPLGLLAVIGDLAPFLLPNRWYQLEESEHLFRAENFGIMVAKENALQFVEGVALEIDRNQRNLQILTGLRKEYVNALNLVKTLESTKELPEGKALSLESKLQLFDQTYAGIEYLLQQQRIDLAEAMGFRNLNAIAGIAPITYADEKFPLTYNVFDIQRRTINTSRELLEIDQLIAAAHSSVGQNLFEWLDPYSDTHAGLGLGLGNYIDIAESSVEQLVGQKQVITASLYKKSAQAFSEWQNNLESIKKTEQNLALQKRRIDLAYQQLENHKGDPAYGDLENALEELTSQSIQRNNQLFFWYASLSQIYRLTHSRYY